MAEKDTYKASLAANISATRHKKRQLLTFLYTWEEGECAPGTAQTHLMHISWWLPQWDERKSGSNREKSVRNAVATFFPPAISFSGCFLSQGLNNPDLQTGDQTKGKRVVIFEMAKKRLPLDYYFAVLRFCTLLTDTFTAYIILMLKSLISRGWSFIFTFIQKPTLVYSTK